MQLHKRTAKKTLHILFDKIEVMLCFENGFNTLTNFKN